MDLEEEIVESTVKEQKDETEEQDCDTSEPYVGMEFDSEDAARQFYADYAREIGFVVRVMQRRRSGTNGRTVARRLGCNKQGFSPNLKGPDKKKKLGCNAREGCNATILVKMEKSGKWVVTRFVRDHNHTLAVEVSEFNTMADKDKKIEELMLELRHHDQLCVAYKEQLLSFVKNVELQNEELSLKLYSVVDNLQRLEREMHEDADQR